MNEELRQLRIQNKLLREDHQGVDAVAVLMNDYEDDEFALVGVIFLALLAMWLHTYA